jgi:hypothetical protein
VSLFRGDAPRDGLDPARGCFVFGPIVSFLLWLGIVVGIWLLLQ